MYKIEFSEYKINFNINLYINSKTNEILKGNKHVLNNTILISNLSSYISIYSYIKTFKYYLLCINKNDVLIKKIIRTLKYILSFYEKKSNILTKNILQKINNVEGLLMELSIEIGICRMQEYYEIYLYTLYKKKWLEENGYKFSKKSYIEFLNILGLEYGIEKWKKGKNIYLKKYKDILDLNFERILEYIYYIFYPSYQILMKEKIVFKTKVNLFKINNYWCLYENVCPELREFLNPLDTEYKYLVYNNTAGKYNYYNKNVKNEIYIFETAYLHNDDKTLLEIKNILI